MKDQFGLCLCKSGLFQEAFLNGIVGSLHLLSKGESQSLLSSAESDTPGKLLGDGKRFALPRQTVHDDAQGRAVPNGKKRFATHI